MALSGVLVSLGTIVAIYGLLTLGLNIKYGYNGLLDIGHVAFFLIGAYTTALLVLAPSESQQFAEYMLGWQWPWAAAILAGTVVAGLAGMLIALPAIRLREDYLAIALLGISVILKRIFQTETWLANGPDALKGWSGPLVDHFPLPGTTLESAVILGVIVFAFWGLATLLTANLRQRVSANPGRRVTDALFAVTTLGIGYVAARRSFVEGRLDWRPASVAGVIAGLVATGMAVVGLGEVAVLVLVGLISLFTWLAAAVIVADHYDDVPRRDGLIGLGLAVAFVGTFMPLVVFGSGAGTRLNVVGLITTVVLLGTFIAGIYRLGSEWDRYGAGESFVAVVGVGAVWLFVIRYFVFSVVSRFNTGGVVGAVAELMQNVLWLVKFAPAGVEFNYSRFVFVLTVGVLSVVYYTAEVTAKSPFGRVLRAIREDEDVARALGKDTFSFKVQSMIVGSAMAGLAGGLFAISLGVLQHLMFEPRVTFVVFLMLIIGGTANNRGVILGSAIFWAFQKGTQDIAAFFPTGAAARVQALRLAFIGALLIIILYYRPQGIWGEERMVTGGREE